jgi:ATP-dependent DNA ligase
LFSATPGIVSKRLGSPYISGRSRTWLKFENPAAPAVKREAEAGDVGDDNENALQFPR